MTSLRRILIGLAALLALGAAAGWLYRRQVDRTPASVPFSVPCPGRCYPSGGIYGPAGGPYGTAAPMPPAPETWCQTGGEWYDD